MEFKYKKWFEHNNFKIDIDTHAIINEYFKQADLEINNLNQQLAKESIDKIMMSSYMSELEKENHKIKKRYNFLIGFTITYIIITIALLLI